MLKAFIFFMMNWLLDVSCSLLSVTVAGNNVLKIIDVKTPFGINMPTYCGMQRSFLDTTWNKSCNLYRWFYDSRTEELTCVCKVDDSTTVNGQLLQIGKARAIPSISESKFRALSSVKQGQYEFELKIVTELPPVETVHNLFDQVAKRNGGRTSTSCTPVTDETNAYTCNTRYQTEHTVTWEFPENWSGPTRFIRNIAYDWKRINIQVVGMYWPKPLHVDTFMTAEDGSTDLCKELFTRTVDKTLKYITRCRLEYLEAVINRTYSIAKINLIMPVLWKENYTMEEVPLWLANRLKWRGYTCSFPVQVRQEAASYVPSEAVAKTVDFEFVLTFSTSIIPTTPQGVLLKWMACETIISRAPKIITKCKTDKIVSSYGIASVTVQSENLPFGEVQKKLMIKLNMESKRVCLFNVAEKVYFKGY